MSISARVFVISIFVVLGTSFIATTAVLYYEFRELNWFSLATFYSHLFIFFPTYGIIALIAFYYPAVVLVDMYWRHVPLGALRFTIGAIVVTAASYFISIEILKGDVSTLWGLKPSVISSDRGEPVNCIIEQQSCKRVPILSAIENVRVASQQRIGLEKFSRTCNPDPLLGDQPELAQKRYCFVTNSLTNAKECCTAQERFSEALKNFYSEPKNWSLTDKLNSYLLPLKVFFLLVLLNIGILLATRRRQIDVHYEDYVGKVERGLIIGALVMLVWPVANHAFLQSNKVLYGPFTDGIYASITPVLTVLFASWALMLLFFFFRRLEKDLEAVGKIAGLLGSAVAIMKYDEIINYAVRMAGSGATILTLSILGFVGLLALIIILFGKKQQRQEG